MLTDDEAAELAALRARAFGPDADLGDDPAGLARLDALEVRSHPETDASPEPPADVQPPAETTQPAPATATPSPEAAPPTAVDSRRTRRTWSRRAVLLVGIPALALAGAAGAALGVTFGQPVAAAVPTPNTTLAAGYMTSFRSISELHTWDVGSPRLLADLSGTLVWDGTTGDGTVTCVVVDDASQLPLSACQATDALTTAGVGVSVADPRTQATRTYVAWPNGAPVVVYYSDDPNPSP